MPDKVDAVLPTEIVDRFIKPFARFLQIKTATGILLLLATLAALILSNSAWSNAFLSFWNIPIGLHFGSMDFTRSLRQWVNDALMTLFFFVVALELKRELVLGELQNPRVAALSLAGALGGMLVPACLYIVLMNGQPGMIGWGAVVATDTAFVIGCLVLLGSRIPPSLRLFLLSLAIFDDVGAILVVAFSGYNEALNWEALAVAISGLIAIAGAARIGVRSTPIYLFLGVSIWFCFDASGLHPTLTGVILGLMTSMHGWVSDKRLNLIFARVFSDQQSDHHNRNTTDRHDLHRAHIAAKEAISPGERLETALHPWVGFVIMPIFALANAGVAISGADIGQSVTVAIIASLVIGKPVGVIVLTGIAVSLGFATKPKELDWRLLAAGSLLTGIGFTMSLFIAGLAYTPALLDAAKIGILAASVISAGSGLLILVWMTSKSPSA